MLILHARRSSSRKIEAAKKSGIVQLMISIGGVMFLFGVTWLFAILTFSSQARETFQILFTVFNSFQGFFIFLFFCAISKEARESWKELFGSGRLSELLHTRHANSSNGNATYNEYDNIVGHQQSPADSSTLKTNDQDMFQTDDSRKNSWGTVMSAYEAEAAFALELSTKRDVFEEDEFGENFSLKTVTIAENDSESEETGSYKDSYSLASSAMELGADHTNFTDTKDGAFSNALFDKSVSSRSEMNGTLETEAKQMRVEMRSQSVSREDRNE